MSDSTIFNVNLFDGAMGGPCFGDGSDSESQQSQATCVGQEDDSVVQTHALGPENIENPMQYSAASTADGPSTNEASSASQSLPFASNDLRPHIDAVDPALACSPFASAFDSAPALESTSASDPAPANNTVPAFNDSPILDTNALPVTETAPSASPKQEDTHIPSQESDIPTFHDDLRFDTAIAQPDSSQDILTTASSTAEPSAYEEQSPSREGLVDHVDDRQVSPRNETADDVECHEDFEAHTVDGGAYNEVHGGDYCAHHDSPAASNGYGDSRHVSEPNEYQSHPSDQEPEEHWAVSHDDVGHSEEVHMGDDAESASSPAYNAEVQMAHADEVCGDVVKEPSPLRPEVGWQLGDEGSDDDLYVRDDEPSQRFEKFYAHDDDRDELVDHDTQFDRPSAQLDEPAADLLPLAVEAPICPPSSSPPSSSPPNFFSSSQASRPSSQSSAMLDPVEKMDEDVVEVTVDKDITGEANAEVVVGEDAREEVVSEDVDGVNMEMGETLYESVGKKTGEDVASQEKQKVATTVKDDIAVDDCEDIAEGMNVSTPAMMTEAARASLQTPLDSHWFQTETALQPDSDSDQGEPMSWHHEEPEVVASLGTEDSATKAPTLTKVDIASNDTATPSEPKPMVPQKRKFEFDEDDIEITRHVPPPPPTTKRPTALAYKAQSKKLAKPFRPPAMKPKVEGDDTVPPSSSPPRTSPPRSSSPAEHRSTTAKPPPVDRKKQHRTQRAASQFKSPLTPGASVAVTSNVRLTPQIQALERKLQVLKRAVKVRREGEEGTLEGLVKRWTEAGREVAWEVWGLTKEAAQGGDWGYGGEGKRGGGLGGGFGKEEDANKGWGWDKEDEKKGGSSWGWANEGGGEAEEEEKDGSAQYKDEEEEVKPQQTLGTMLRLLGIAPETLGWDDNEEGFVDA